MLRILAILAPLHLVYGAIGPVADMYIVNKAVAPDGFTRSGVLVGGKATNAQFPGPLITGNKDDRFRLNVIDSLTDKTMLRATSIHWHGLFQHKNSWADGPVGVTQCPISPGHSFLYDFTARDQAGTFWYHSHYSTQYCDGLRGPLVVYDPKDPHRHLYDVDDESTIITLSDWYHKTAHEATSNGTLVPIADSVLINGKGRYPTGPSGALHCSSASPAPLSVLNVKKNTRYRFRLVSLSCDPNFTFSIANHTLTIIEVDGVNVQPVEVDSIQIFAGQRYSFVLNANQVDDNYWIRAIPNGPMCTGIDGGLNSAILRYHKAPDREPTETIPPVSIKPMIETDLHPLENPGALGGPGDKNVIPHPLDIEFTGRNFTVNGETFVPPSVPVLLQILSGARKPEELLPKVIKVPRNKVIELKFTSTSNNSVAGSPHPFHLHGHTFDVIRSAGNKTFNYDNPVRRDVVSTGNLSHLQDEVTIRFKTDNPGPWILHCHIDWHLELGLAIVFVEDAPSIPLVMPPASWDTLCPIYDAQPPEFPVLD